MSPEAQMHLRDSALSLGPGGAGAGDKGRSGGAGAASNGGPEGAGGGVGAGDRSRVLSGKSSSFFRRNVALLRERLLRSNQVGLGQAELDQPLSAYLYIHHFCLSIRQLTHASRPSLPSSLHPSLYIHVYTHTHTLRWRWSSRSWTSGAHSTLSAPMPSQGAWSTPPPRAAAPRP